MNFNWLSGIKNPHLLCIYHYNNNTLNAIINFEFGNETHEEDFHYYNCVFNGQNNDIVGECAGGEHIDHINIFL